MQRLRTAEQTWCDSGHHKKSTTKTEQSRKKEDIQTTIEETISSKINEIENKLPTANNNIEKIPQ